jgi:hypothetical protein
MRVTPRGLRAGGPFSTTTPTERSAHMATDQISFYDESLKKQIEGTFISDGKSIHIHSAYGNKSVAYNDLARPSTIMHRFC